MSDCLFCALTAKLRAECPARMTTPEDAHDYGFIVGMILGPGLARRGSQGVRSCVAHAAAIQATLKHFDLKPAIVWDGPLTSAPGGAA